MKKEPLFNYNPESGEASCLIEDKDGNIIYGIAKCHPDDMDMAKNEGSTEMSGGKSERIS